MKPRNSSVISFSHDLLIVRDKQTLVEKVLRLPEYDYLKTDTIIVQEYIMRHSETLLKLYAIGTKYDTIFKKTFPLAAIEHFL